MSLCMGVSCPSRKVAPMRSASHCLVMLLVAACPIWSLRASSETFPVRESSSFDRILEIQPPDLTTSFGFRVLGVDDLNGDGFK